MHLIPSFGLIAALILAWRWEWIGVALYGAAGLLYVVWVASAPRPWPAAMRLILALGSKKYATQQKFACVKQQAPLHWHVSGRTRALWSV